jgi:hypothetical protein
VGLLRTPAKRPLLLKSVGTESVFIGVDTGARLDVSRGRGADGVLASLKERARVTTSHRSSCDQGLGYDLIPDSSKLPGAEHLSSDRTGRRRRPELSSRGTAAMNGSPYRAGHDVLSKDPAASGFECQLRQQLAEIGTNWRSLDL